jgi:hypothetical protein
MKTESNIARQAIFEIIENQLKDNNPPITKETYMRLTSKGYSKQDAMKLIGCALSSELSDIMKSNEPFNEERYSRNLKNLPELPWDEE